jgi:hypothetical protein
MSEIKSISKENLKARLNLIRDKIQTIQVCSSNVRAIIAEDKNGTNLYPIKGFLDHYVIASYVQSVIQLSILFKTKEKGSEKTSFQHLFNSLVNENYDGTINSQFDENRNSDITSLFRTKKEVLLRITESKRIISNKQQLIDKIIRRREKCYAHTDSDYKTVERESLNDIEELNSIAMKIYDEINGSFFNVTFQFYAGYWSIESVLKDRKKVDEYYKNLEDKLEKN